MKKKLLSSLLAGFVLSSGVALADVVEVTMTAKEVELAIDNSGTTQRVWTFDGQIPGPLVRVKQGDTINFTLHNDPNNEQSHSMDFHASQVDVLDEFEEIKPGDVKKYSFTANYPGTFVYHCGADSMAEHISRGMYGVIIVDPVEGYTEDFPKPDREYVLVQGDLFTAGTSAEDRKLGNHWEGALINGKHFHYSPVHDPNASLVMEAKPGERVRIHYANAMINSAASVHPIAGIMDRVWDNGNPKNVLYGMQTIEIGAAHAVAFDLIGPEGRDSNYAVVDHRMKHALSGAISVLMIHDGADDELGRGDKLLLR